MADSAYAQQRRRAERVLDSVPLVDLQKISPIGWEAAEKHGLEPQRGHASCECLVIEVVAGLQDLGYEIVPPRGDSDG